MCSNMKLHYVTFCVVYAYFGTVKFTDGRSLQDAGSCESEQGKCTRDIYENVRLRALKSSGCTKFCQCEHASTETDGSVTYKWAEHSCAPGLLFDEEIKVCNWPQQVQCQANVPEDCETELGQCTKFIYDVTRLRALKSSGCTKFCQCEHASTESDGSLTYKWAEHTCAPGLLFDEEIKVCNWPGNVQCNANGNGDNGGVVGGGGNSDNGGIGGDDGAQGSADNGAGSCESEQGTCTRDIYENVRLRALKSSGCTKFCQCEHASTETDGSVTYKWAEHTCAPGLLFDEEIKVCNWPQQVQCQANVPEDCETELGQCTKFIYDVTRLRALKSSGCTKFCQCEHASTESDGSVTYKWAEHTCAPGLLFDEEIKVCNWPGNVQCNANGNGDNGGVVGGGGNSDNGGIGGDGDGVNGGDDGAQGSPDNANVPEDCEKELGQCSKFIYDVIRLRALKSSGCTKFCQCEHASTETDGSVTYKWAEHSCAPGLLFDEEIKVCNWPNNVQCNANDVDDCEKEHGECTAFVYENVRLRPLKSSGCTKFCQCEHASTEADGSVTYKWAEHTCPPGLLFDVKTSVCNWPQNVQCDGNGDNGGTDNGGTDNGGTDNGGTDNGGTDNGGTDNGGTDNGGTDNGGTDNGGTDNGGTDNGGTDNGGTDNGGTDNGGTDNGGTDNGGTDNGGTDNGGSDNGGTDNGGTDNGGTDNGGSNGDNGNNGDGGNGGNNGDTDFECFKCYKSDSNKECNKNKEVCESDKETCQTRIEWKGDTYEVSKGCVNSDSSSSEDDSGTSSKETSSKSSSDESSDNSKEKSSKSSKEGSSKSSKEGSSKSSKESSSKSSKEGSSKSSKEGSSKSSKEGSSKSSKEGSSKSSKEKSSKSSKEKSSKSSKEDSSKSSKEKSTKSSKEKSTKSSKEKSSKSSKDRSRRSTSDLSGCKKNGKKITCTYECTSSLCNEFLPPLYIE